MRAVPVRAVLVVRYVPLIYRLSIDDGYGIVSVISPYKATFSRNKFLVLSAASFPTPMEEPKKVLRAQYIGSLEVDQPTGMEVLNDAIGKLVTTTPVENWDNVNVSVAPSMISVNTSVSS